MRQRKRHLQWFGHLCRLDIARLPFKLLWHQRPPMWKIHRNAPTWVKQVKDSLKSSRLTLVDTKTLYTDRLAWSQVVEVAGRLSAPTAAYEQRSCLGTTPAKSICARL